MNVILQFSTPFNSLNGSATMDISRIFLNSPYGRTEATGPSLDNAQSLLLSSVNIPLYLSVDEPGYHSWSYDCGQSSRNIKGERQNIPVNLSVPYSFKGVVNLPISSSSFS
ncbi:hypothetical protein ACOSP7_029269 [Xanthoceras sorbifolium]